MPRMLPPLPPVGKTRFAGSHTLASQNTPWVAFSILLAVLLADGFLVRRHSQHALEISLHEKDPVSTVFALGQGDFVPEARLLEPNGPGEAPAMVIEHNGKTVLRLPYTRVDRTNRTHLATLGQGRSLRILVFDAVSQKTPHRAVFAFSGERMAEVSPTPEDRSILAALASVDDGGTLLYWDLFFLFRPILAALILGAIWIGLRRQDKKRGGPPVLQPWDGINRRFSPSADSGGTVVPSPLPTVAPIPQR
ncbi:MAG: hypothetical protein IPP35_06425 [Elusimicrobia bacterium]|nr:hypothetical protein [Elusimicrobiota bacterium]